MTYFDEFGKKWASQGSIQPISETQREAGWDFLGSVPPISGQFNQVQQNTDEKINYLFNLLNAFIISRGGSLTINSTNELRNLINEALQAAQGGHVGYVTHAEMLADTSRPVGTIAEVFNDPDSAKNGYYLFTSTGWVKQKNPFDGEKISLQGTVYDTEVEGRVASVDGQTFKVKPIGSNNIAAFEYRRINDTTSELVAAYPSLLYVNSIEQNTSKTILLDVEGWATLTVDEEKRLIQGISDKGIMHITSADIKALKTPGIGQQYPTIDSWVNLQVDSKNRPISGLTDGGAQYATLPGKGLTKISDPADITQMKDEISALQQGAGIVNSSSLAHLVGALKNPLTDVTVVAIGSSSTWGRTLQDGAPYEPRNGTLADVRNNLTSPSYMNLLINYLGHVYTNTALADRATEETAPGAPAGGAARFVDTGKFVDPMASNLVGLYSQIGEPIEKTATAHTSGPMVVSPLNVPPGAYIEFVVTGAHFRIVYATTAVNSGAEYDVEIDGISDGVRNYYSATQLWSQVDERSFAFGTKTVRVKNNSTSATLIIEAITRDKTVRIVNQGIIGTATSSWQPGGVRLDACLHAESTHMLVMIGSNDRGATVYPPNVTKTKEGNRNIVRHIRDVKGLKVILMAGQATTEDYPEVPAKTYSQQDIANAIGELAKEENVSFINMYPRTRQALLDGEAILADGLHPNEAGHRINFEIVKDALESI